VRPPAIVDKRISHDASQKRNPSLANPIHTTNNGRPSQAGNRIADFGKDTRFKKEKSGNPTGRPKRKPSESDLYHLVRQILMRNAGGLRE
jgi:hypothetical protein